VAELLRLVQADQAQQLLGPVEGEDRPAAGGRVEQVGELGDGAGRFVVERDGELVGGYAGGHALDVSGGLSLLRAGHGITRMRKNAEPFLCRCVFCRLPWFGERLFGSM
jgi:hypothetical protein